MDSTKVYTCLLGVLMSVPLMISYCTVKLLNDRSFCSTIWLGWKFIVSTASVKVKSRDPPPKSKVNR